MRLEVEMRRLFEAAVRDRKPQRFFEEVEKAFRENHIKPKELSVRRLFENFVPNGRELLSEYDPRTRALFAGNVHLLEEAGAIKTTNFQAITGNAIYSQMLDTYDNEPNMIGEDLVDIMPSSLYQEELPGVGEAGDMAEAVPEQGEFPYVGVNEELIRTPRTKKYGYQVALTWEMTFFDRFGLVLERASNIGRWLRVSREKRILDTVFGINNTYIRNDQAYDTYLTSGSWINHKTSNALADWTDVEAAELLFDAMTDPNTGEPIVTIPDTLIVPTALSKTADYILNAIQVREGSALAGAADTSAFARQTLAANPLKNQLKILSSQYVKARTSSASTWFIGSPKKAFKLIENAPMTVEPLTPGDYSFSRHIVTGWRGWEMSSVAVIEPRHMVKNTA